MLPDEGRSHKKSGKQSRLWHFARHLLSKSNSKEIKGSIIPWQPIQSFCDWFVPDIALAQLRICLKMGNFRNVIHCFKALAWMLVANVEWMDLLRSHFGGTAA